MTFSGSEPCDHGSGSHSGPYSDPTLILSQDKNKRIFLKNLLIRYVHRARGLLQDLMQLLVA